MSILLLAIFFATEAAADFLSILFHDARERRDATRLGVYAAVLGVFSWLPVWFVIATNDWRIAAASVLGGVAGTLLGLTRLDREQDKPVVPAGAFFYCEPPGGSPSLQDGLGE